MLSGKTLNELKKRSVSLSPLIRLGKNGINDNVISEIDKMLSKRGLVKIKLLRSYTDITGIGETIETITKKTGSDLVSQKGYVITVYRKPKALLKDHH
ncbi:MAG: YhbY family RNA-binding protein [Candidatus Woesearchaeota archaeon]